MHASHPVASLPGYHQDFCRFIRVTEKSRTRVWEQSYSHPAGMEWGLLVKIVVQHPVLPRDGGYVALPKPVYDTV